MTIHLREISIPPNTEYTEEYPFNVPLVQQLGTLSFESPVTLFVGENGSGKSTLLEAIASAAGMITVGSDEIERDQTMDSVKPLVDVLKLVWNKRTHRGFFLRAEDFFGFVKRMRDLRQSMEEEVDRIDADYHNRSAYAKSLAKMPAQSSLSAMVHRYGEDLDSRSHGESFLTLFQSRFVPGGLYLLDEPEAALSPIRQFGLISMIKEMVAQDAQFIVATHSPIIMAIPEAVILDFDQALPVPIAYDDVEHVRLYRSFLSAPGSFLGKL